MTFILFLFAIGVICLYIISLYNALVKLKHDVKKNWANIEVALKQRHDELPKLIEVCKHYAQFEQSTLTQVMEARAAQSEAARAQNVSRVGELESTIRGLMGNIYAVVEAYPDLKADQQFTNLSHRMTLLENTLSDRRELYNESININNVRIEQFPDVLVAKLFGFGHYRPLSFPIKEQEDVDVSSLFKS